MEKIFKKNRHKYLWLLVALFLVLYFFIDWNLNEILASRESLKEFVESFGAIGPLILILIIVTEVIFAPIPGFVPAVTAGFIFGHFLGTICIYLGNIIGTLIVFFLAKEYGRYIIYRFFRKDKLNKYEKAIERHENWLLAFYFLPILPLDILTAAFGLSVIKPRKFILVILVSYFIYAMIFSFFGDLLAETLL